MKRAPSELLVERVRALVADVADADTGSEVDAVKVVALALVRVAGEVAASDVADELRSMLALAFAPRRARRRR